MSDNESSIGGFGWFLAGLGLGALVGVLYAPKSSKETREDIVAGALEARDRANQVYNQGVEQVNQFVQQGKQTADEYVDKGKDLIQSQTDADKAAVEAGKEAFVAKSSATAKPSETTPVA